MSQSVFFPSPISLCIIQIFRIHFLYSYHLLFTFHSALFLFISSHSSSSKTAQMQPSPTLHPNENLTQLAKVIKSWSFKREKKVVCWEKHFGKWIMIAHSTSQESSQSASQSGEREEFSPFVFTLIYCFLAAFWFSSWELNSFSTHTISKESCAVSGETTQSVVTGCVTFFFPLPHSCRMSTSLCALQSTLLTFVTWCELFSVPSYQLLAWTIDSFALQHCIVLSCCVEFIIFTLLAHWSSFEYMLIQLRV